MNFKMINFKTTIIILIAALSISCSNSSLQLDVKSNLVEIGDGWSKNSVNAAIFRKNSMVSTANYQFAAYYNSNAHVVIARRKNNSSDWEIKETKLKGNIRDAHNVICIMTDGEGYLHIAYDHHNNPLHYAVSTTPEGLTFQEAKMIGENEGRVTYPEFYQFSNGDLLFAYRDGGSGNGNLVLNKYDLKEETWHRVQSNLIDGEGQRNAYWQLYLAENNHIYLSWVWRENPNVASNHDMCFAYSADGGKTWLRSDETAYELPINIKNAEVVYPIPQNSNLINQTAMTADEDGNAYIATYFKEHPDSCTQFFIIYQHNDEWNITQTTNRTLDFQLGGVGSRSIPISRPQLIAGNVQNEKTLCLIYRDEELNNNIAFAYWQPNKMKHWKQKIVSPYPVDRYEPSYDSEKWKREKQLDLYFQRVGQGQGEGLSETNDQTVGVLEIKFN